MDRKVILRVRSLQVTKLGMRSHDHDEACLCYMMRGGGRGGGGEARLAGSGPLNAPAHAQIIKMKASITRPMQSFILKFCHQSAGALVVTRAGIVGLRRQVGRCGLEVDAFSMFATIALTFSVMTLRTWSTRCCTAAT